MDLATPSAADMGTINAVAATDKPKKVKPERPDDAKYKEALAKAEKAHAINQEKQKALRAKIDLARPNPDGPPTPQRQRQQDLKTQLTQIRQQQQSGKSSRAATQERIKLLDQSLKARQTEQKAARGKVSFRNVEEIDQEIARLEKQVEGAAMKIVDERKALDEVSKLRKVRKGFAGMDQAEKGISDVKAEIAQLKKQMDDPASKSLSDKYTEIQKELDSIKSEQDGVFKNLNSLRDEHTKAKTESDKSWAILRQIKDDYYGQKKAAHDWEQEAYVIRNQRKRAEAEATKRENRKRVAEERLEEAGQPAYTDEIISAEGLIRYFDPTALPASSNTNDASKYAAAPRRTVDDSQMKGTVLKKKEDREDDFFIGSAKKGKKGKRGTGASGSPAPATSSSSTGKYNLSVGVLEDLGKLNMDPPMNKDDVPAVVDKLKAKIETFKKDQETQTKKNIDKAKKEIAKLEAEEDALEAQEQEEAGKSESLTNGARKGGRAANSMTVKGTQGAEAQRGAETAGVLDAAKDLKAASLEDKTAASTA